MSMGRRWLACAVRHPFSVLFVVSSFLYVVAMFMYLRGPEGRIGFGSRGDIFVASAYALDEHREGIGHTVRMISLAPSGFAASSLYCKNWNGEVSRAVIEPLGGPMHCKWENVFVDCTFMSPISGVSLIGENGAAIEIPIRRASPDPKKLVVCFARMFSFDNWRVALTAIELYRYHGVDLFSIPIISVIRELYDILKHYEEIGFVRLTEGVVMPKLRGRFGGEFDPNTEVEFFNQVISSTECLYEYRNSEFVIFADFDDVIIPRRGKDLYQELLGYSHRMPNAASFEFLRDPNTVIHFGRSPGEFNFDETTKRIALTGKTVSPGKTVVVPSRLREGFIHIPRGNPDILGNYTHHRMDGLNHPLFLHLRDYVFDVQSWTDGPISYVNKIDYSSIQRRFLQRIYHNPAIKKAFENLPSHTPYYDAMAHCYETVADGLQSNKVFCPNPLNCHPKYQSPLPKCVGLESDFESAHLGDGLIIHQTERTRFAEWEDCLY